MTTRAAPLAFLYGVALRFEERDLDAFHGDEHRAYSRRTPILIPGLKRRSDGDV